ncbi:MAG: hypothetical protein CXZ00_09350 [Acidobacteria bacterium]|nr:MAG: hypothetical protein CXZ00_09350 [Acidobacteriota bacterium]
MIKARNVPKAVVYVVTLLTVLAASCAAAQESSSRVGLPIQGTDSSVDRNIVPPGTAKQIGQTQSTPPASKWGPNRSSTASSSAVSQQNHSSVSSNGLQHKAQTTSQSGHPVATRGARVGDKHQGADSKNSNQNAVRKTSLQGSVAKNAPPSEFKEPSSFRKEYSPAIGRSRPAFTTHTHMSRTSTKHKRAASKQSASSKGQHPVRNGLTGAKPSRDKAPKNRLSQTKSKVLIR